MARPIILGNGSLTVGLNEQGLVHDFYYPYVGLDNLTTSRSTHHKIGVWVDGKFTWVDDGSWQISVDFEPEAMVSTIRMYHEYLGIELMFIDFVDDDTNAFCRKIHIANQRDDAREMRLFMHQVFQISRAGRADTALFVPEENYILDYKGRCSLLVYGQTTDGQVYDQFAIGNYGIEGKEGTFRDAEDGELSGSAVEHGGVDSVIRFLCPLDGHKGMDIDYWIVAADSQYTAEKIHCLLKHDGLKKRLKKVREYWQTWLAPAADTLTIIDKKYVVPVKKSLMMIKVHCDRRGGVIASCDSSIYNYGRDYYSYVWPRDGAYALWPLIRSGFREEPKRFFEFCRDTLNPEGYLMHKYQPDRAIGSTWHPMLHGKHAELAIQEDETASVLYMLGEYYTYSKDEDFVYSLYGTFIQPAANFMAQFIDEQTRLPHASYDLWEEKFLTTTYTTAVVYQALLVAADFADKFEYPDDAVHWRAIADDILDNFSVFFDAERQSLRKGFLLKEDGSLELNNTLDVSSLYGPMIYGYYDSTDALLKTANVIEQTLLDQSPSGGSPRFEYDNYFASNPAYMGNPWIVTTMWMAQYYIRTKNYAKATDYVDWAIDHSLASGVLSEQVNPSTASPISVTPLVWSHAELINTVLDLYKDDKTRG